MPEGLFEQVNDEALCGVSRVEAAVAEKISKQHPEQRLAWWGKDLGPDTLDLIGGMTDLDPGATFTIDQVLSHRAWELDAEAKEADKAEEADEADEADKADEVDGAYVTVGYKSEALPESSHATA